MDITGENVVSSSVLVTSVQLWKAYTGIGIYVIGPGGENNTMLKKVLWMFHIIKFEVRVNVSLHCCRRQ